MPREILFRHRVALALAAIFLTHGIASPLIAQQSGPNVYNAGAYGPPFTAGNGHLSVGGGPAPSINAACGTAPVAPVGTDSAFSFTSGTSTSAACALTPATPWSKRPTCSVDAQVATQPAWSISAAGVITLSGVADSTTYNVVCIGQPGG